MNILKKELHGSNAKKRVGLALFILIFALVIFTGYFLFFYEKPCNDIECFKSAMKNCRPVSWIRQDEQASWLYIIKGASTGDTCKIQVKLLEVKQGTIDSEVLEGKKMTCLQLKGDTRFPEKDISGCTGVLKEELQDLIIQRMHNYLLENVGEIQQGFSEL
jgi:hypothetical protein